MLKVLFILVFVLQNIFKESLPSAFLQKTLLRYNKIRTCTQPTPPFLQRKEQEEKKNGYNAFATAIYFLRDILKKYINWMSR